MVEKDFVGEFDASDFVNLALSPIPSAFGQLVFLADLLRDHNVDPLAELLYGKEQIDAALQAKHCEIFSAWLGISLAMQMADVAEYLACECGTNDTTIANLLQRWIHENLQERLRPAAASASEWGLFSSDLQAVLGLLAYRLGPSESLGLLHKRDAQ